MWRKIILLSIGCIFCYVIHAQQQRLLDLSKQGKITIDSLMNMDTLSKKCKDNLKLFKTRLPQKTIAQDVGFTLYKTSVNIIEYFTKSTEGKIFENLDNVEQLLSTTNAIISELKTLQMDKAPAKDPFLKLLIKLTDSSSGKPLQGKIIIDSSGSIVNRVNNHKDSSVQYDTAFLIPKFLYTVTANADGYNQTAKKLRVSKNGEVVKLKLSKKTQTSTADTIKPPKPDTVAAVVPVVIPKEATGNNWIMLLIAGILLVPPFIIYLISLIKSIRYRGWNLLSFADPIAPFKTAITKKDVFINTLNKSIEVAEMSFLNEKQKVLALEQKNNEQVIPTPVVPEVVPAKTSPVTEKYFTCEIMMTAGPRKKNMSEDSADKDLGEDTSGFVLTSKEVFAWVLDGTSDEYCLKDAAGKEYFSSRLLVQSIANKIRMFIAEEPVKELSEIINQAVIAVREDWLNTISTLSQSEQALLKRNIESGNIPQCSATLLLAKLAANGDFACFRSGDSRLFLYSEKAVNELKFVETTLKSKNPVSDDRTFVRLHLDDNGNFVLISNEPLSETVKEKNIKLVVAFSDGIGPVTEQSMTEMLTTANDIKNKIVLQKQGTADDKSICFIEVM